MRVKACFSLFRREPIIYVYDPNGFNSYGLELATILSKFNSNVRHLAHVDAPHVRSESIRQDVVFRRSFGAVMRLFWLFVKLAIRPGIVILCWVPSPWHLRVVLGLASLSKQTFFVDHNPAGRRAAKGPLTMLQRNRLLTHPKISPLLHHGCEAEPDVKHLYQGAIYHPSYTRLVLANSASLASDSEAGVCLFFGSARKEKGVDYLPSIEEGLSALGASLRVRVGKCSPAEATRLRRIACDVQVGVTSHISDAQLLHEISRARVVVAPYSEVTMSGTAVLAASVGTPIVMFDSPAMSWLVPAENMVPVGDIEGMVARIAELTNAPDGVRSDEAFLMSPAELDSVCFSGWRDLMNEVR